MCSGHWRCRRRRFRPWIPYCTWFFCVPSARLVQVDRVFCSFHLPPASPSCRLGFPPSPSSPLGWDAKKFCTTVQASFSLLKMTPDFSAFCRRFFRSDPSLNAVSTPRMQLSVCANSRSCIPDIPKEVGWCLPWSCSPTRPEHLPRLTDIWYQIRFDIEWILPFIPYITEQYDPHNLSRRLSPDIISVRSLAIVFVHSVAHRISRRTMTPLNSHPFTAYFSTRIYSLFVNLPSLVNKPGWTMTLLPRAAIHRVVLGVM